MESYIWYICALLNFGIAVLHIVIIAMGAPAYQYFGAGEWMVAKSEAGSLMPALVTSAVTVVFIIFAIYCLAGAKAITTNLPWLFYGLAAIAAIYLLRGAIVVTIPFIDYQTTTFDRVSSYISLGIGALHTWGVYLYYTGGVKV